MESPISFRMEDVIENEFSVKDSAVNEQFMEVKVTVGLGADFGSNVLAINIIAIYKNNTNIEFIRANDSFIYGVENMANHVQLLENGKIIANQDFIGHLIGLSIGMFRGIIYTKTKSMNINKQFLPFVNLEPIINDILNIVK